MAAEASRRRRSKPQQRPGGSQHGSNFDQEGRNERSAETECIDPGGCCTSIKASIAFYTEILGFEILFQREEATFAMLERQGAQVMLDEYVQGSARSGSPGHLKLPLSGA
jgi:hypothetical protein